MKKLTILLLMILLLTGCGNQTLTIRNETGYELSEVQIYENSESKVIETANGIANHTEWKVKISSSKGDSFALFIKNATDDTEKQITDLHLDADSVITLYTDAMGIAVALDMSDEEIESEKQRVADVLRERSSENK